LGHALLWWCAAEGNAKSITLFDAYPNMEITPEFISGWAEMLLKEGGDDLVGFSPRARSLLQGVASGSEQVEIHYRIGGCDELATCPEAPFDLVLSQAAFEHVWQIEKILAALRKVTAANGLHSHLIDLADHGSIDGVRHSNYLEMLEWSDWAYWLTMAFTPGALNRWRATEFIDGFVRNGFEVLDSQRELRDALPPDLGRLARRYRRMDNEELRTVELSVILKPAGNPS
jgi:hypothetical protein